MKFVKGVKKSNFLSLSLFLRKKNHFSVDFKKRFSLNIDWYKTPNITISKKKRVNRIYSLPPKSKCQQKHTFSVGLSPHIHGTPYTSSQNQKNVFIYIFFHFNLSSLQRWHIAYEVDLMVLWKDLTGTKGHKVWVKGIYSYSNLSIPIHDFGWWALGHRFFHSRFSFLSL